MRRLVIFILITVGLLARTGAENRADSLLNCAKTKVEEGFPDEALSDAFEILKLDKKRGQVDPETLAETCLLAGNIYLFYNDFVTSSKYYERGLATTRRPAMQQKFYNNLTVNYCMTGDEAGARRTWRKQSLSGDKANDYDIAIGEAFIEKTFGSRSRSSDLFKRAIAIAETQPSRQGALLTPLSELGEYYDKSGQLDSALIYMTRYEQEATKYKVPQMIADSQMGLMRVYIKRGDNERALLYSNRYLATMDTLVRLNSFLNKASQWERSEEEAAQADIKNLQFTISLQTTVIYGIVIVALIIALIWIYHTKLKGYTRQLFQRNRELAMGGSAVDAPALLPQTAGDGDEEDIQSRTALMQTIEEVMSRPENFCNPDFSIAMLAKLVGSNTHYISEAINKTTGENFRTLLNRYRIGEARRRMTNDPASAMLTLKSIGEAVGFKSPSNFINAFKKMTGMPPSLYQKMAKSSNIQ